MTAEDTGSLLPKGIVKPPKISRQSMTPEEREEAARAKREAAKAEKKAAKAPKTPWGRWWRNVQNGPNRIQLGMCIVALGVVYGDIGTSPLYMAQSFLSGQGGIQYADRHAVLGMLSLLFWAITLITTIKYVFIAMRIDNKGEGGIFALFSLVRRYGKWLAIPAMIGGAAFLADSVLTPAVSISSAVEGLTTIPQIAPIFDSNANLTLMITVVIIVVLFCIQSRGTERIGKVFGIVVMVWFSFLAVVGVANLGADWTVFEALNPWLGVEFLFDPANKAGLAIMGTVFLATTGAEALYSDMGHVGRGNIYATWPFIKVALVLNYFGQGAWMLRNQGNEQLYGIKSLNPFFQMMTPSIRSVAVILSVAAGVIASQALITGAFTMISEATSLNWMPHLQVRYPARTRGQLYIPTVNLVLCVATITVLALFRDSEHITAAYGLALTVTMITTTILLAAYIWCAWKRRVFAIVFAIVFLAIQILFFLASMSKFLHGGWFTMLLTLLILGIMYTWDQGTKVERSQRRHMWPKEFLPALDALHRDFKIPYYADNLVYLTSDNELRRLDTDIFYSIFANHPKRARAWWAVSVQVTDDPFTREYSVENFGTSFLFRVRIRLGFKVSQNVATYLHQIMHDLIKDGTLPRQSSIYPKVDADPEIGTIRYVLVHKALMPESKITSRGATSLRVKYAIRHVAGNPVKWFGLTAYNPVVEIQPLFVSTHKVPALKRVALRKPKRPVTLQEIRAEQRDEEENARAAEISARESHEYARPNFELRPASSVGRGKQASRAADRSTAAL
ncbi:potassium transporter Kup [Bifidobacterium primatium]|uniref:Probable potassium transport system protein Kup n=1 Tax=Bifidobacterium primatium TaxID=2045438 RepID=A0A2M9HBB8_9BIFI|nr:KUP/HAK/KT family potassium transporter [Bifidobacterium primatium]PJM74099.1 potassium transporter Kup [Bifidobacterium primatium]